MTKIVERGTLTVEAQILLSEKHLVAMSKVLEWGAEECADAILERIGTQEARAVRPGLVDLFQELRTGLPNVIRKGQDARAVFSGLAKAVRERE